MAKLIVQEKESILVIQLNNGFKNPIDGEVCAELSAAVDNADQRYDGMIITGGERFYSLGFDLPSLLKLDRPRMSDFFYGFQDVILKITRLKMPTVAAITGHAVAGGTILVLCQDYRIAASERLMLGLNEIQLGVSVPYIADMLMRRIVGERVCNNLLYTGELIDSNQAAAFGLVDEICPRETVFEKAVEKMEALMSVPKATYGAIKENAIEDVVAKYQQNNRAKTERFLDLWFSPEGRRRLNEALEKF